MTKHRRPPETVPREPPPDDAPEGVRAEWYRVHVLGMSRSKLAETIGYGVEQIRKFEVGEQTDSSARQRYRMMCAALAAGVTDFDWKSVTTTTKFGVERVTRFDE